MATVYVKSTGSDTSPYDTWAKAATSLDTADGFASAGDEVWVDYQHSETFAATKTLDFANGTNAAPVKILSVNSADDTLLAGATYGTTAGAYDLNINGSFYIYGFTFPYGRSCDIADTDVICQFDTCTLDRVNSAASGNDLSVGGVRSSLEFVNCTFKWDSGNNANGYMRFNQRAQYRLIDCTFTPHASQTHFFESALVDAMFDVELIGCDIGTATDIVDLGTEYIGLIAFRDCKFASGWDLYTGTKTAGQRILVERCTDGTISVPEMGITQYETFRGSITSSLSRYRTGGADDGTNAHSWEFISSANATEIYRALRSPAITRWVDAGDSQTVTVYLAGGATLNDDDFWVEVTSPNEIDSPNTEAQGNFQSTRVGLRTTPAPLTTDSGWTGTGVGTMQKIDVTINPAVAGPVVVRVCLAKPSTTVYVDPRIDVS